MTISRVVPSLVLIVVGRRHPHAFTVVGAAHLVNHPGQVFPTGLRVWQRRHHEPTHGLVDMMLMNPFHGIPQSVDLYRIRF